MTQRIITGCGLLAILLVLMYFGGAVLGSVAMLCTFVAIFEEFRALRQKGYSIVAWPTWAGVSIGAVLLVLTGAKVIVPVMAAICMLTLLIVIFREEPSLNDVIMSLVPLFTIALPGLSVTGIAMIQPKSLQVALLSLLFAVPVLCDTLAFFVGSNIRGPKLCVRVSPNKTVSGAVGGMIGAVLAAMIVYALMNGMFPAEAASLPRWWQCLLIGLAGGVVSQLGDLFASMVKRHCGIKDFGNIFPGHGGMLDRCDSIFFMAVAVYCFRLLSM